MKDGEQDGNVGLCMRGLGAMIVFFLNSSVTRDEKSTLCSLLPPCSSFTQLLDSPSTKLQVCLSSSVMSKRDANQLDSIDGEERGAKQARCSEEAADVTTASAASAAASGAFIADFSIATATSVSSTDPNTLQQARTRKLVSATLRSGSLTERMKATCALLKADGERAESLLDMSLRVEGHEVSQADSCVLLGLIAAESASLIVAVSACAAAAPGRLRVRAVSSS